MWLFKIYLFVHAMLFVGQTVLEILYKGILACVFGMCLKVVCLMRRRNILEKSALG